MKNIILIGLASLVLFGVAAGLSVWLQMNTAKSADTSHGEEKDKKKKPADDHGEAKPTDKEHSDPHKAEAKAGETKPTEAKPAVVNKDADRVEYRRLQMEVVASDLNGQMQDYDRLLKLVGAEMKLIQAQQSQQDGKAEEAKKTEAAPTKTASDVKKTPTEADETERANIARIAALADQMPAETTAGIIQQLADSGKTDTAVKVLAGMKDRTAAKVLAAISDPTIPPLLIERMQTLKRAAPVNTP